VPLFIQTTGIEDYAPGGKARVKILLIGGPGVGKTRMSSYYPQPIYADCEGGLASVADRKVPYVRVNTSQDMLDLLAHLKQECKVPVANRKYQTIVIDTIDAFQRKVKNEWLEKEKTDVFTGWEAWGYVNARMNMLLTRLLNLDMNVIVCVHYKDKAGTKDEGTSIVLQLQGETGDIVYNDFDLVAWMGTYWEAVEGERVQKRGLTFKATPDRPFLKDRLHVTPPWMEVTFADSDYTNLFDAIQSRVEDLEPGAVVGEVPSERQDVSSFVVPPGGVGTGEIPGAGTPVPPTYVQMDKPTLTKLCRDRGITTTVDGTVIKNNTLKAELIAALEANRDAETAAAAAAPTTPARPEPKPAADPDPPPAPTQPVADPRLLVNVPEGVVNVKTGELGDPMEKAVELVGATLGGQVIPDTIDVTATEASASVDTPPEPAAPTAVVCEVCAKDLSNEDPDFVKLSWIKFRKRLCESDFRKHKAGNTR
jgi:AAA domain-containing protein